MNHTLSPGQPRDHLFDNIKALMLFLVPLGHTLDVFIADGNVEEILMKYIYLFHMPIFAFVTGYFTKKSGQGPGECRQKMSDPLSGLSGALHSDGGRHAEAGACAVQRGHL